MSADHLAITQLLARYCRGIDRRDRTLLESVYWPEAMDNHTTFVGTAAGFIDWAMERLPLMAGTMHMLGQSSIAIEGNRAGGETYFQAFHTFDTDQGQRMDVAAGRYVDRLEKRGEEWRIIDRVVLIDWNHQYAVAPYIDAGRRQPGWVAPQPGPQDHSYAVLAL